MKVIKITFLMILLASLAVCGQIGNHDHKEIEIMETTKITNAIAKKAINAWQQKDAKTWNSLFIANPELLDDGSPRDFKKFSQEIGAEYFTSIDKVENNGQDVYGHFHSDTWGDFKTYFKFKINSDAKIIQLEIGKAEY